MRDNQAFPAAAVDAAAVAILQGVHGEATIQELAELALEAAAPHMQVGNYTCPSECAATNHPGAEHGAAT